MVSLTFVFWLFVILFALIGAMRGWAREILVSASVILALFLLTIMISFIPPAAQFFRSASGSARFWIQAIVLLVLVFFGYQTPNIPRVAGARFARERLSDALLGFFLGALNGYLIVGSLWYFLDQSSYPFPKWVLPPDPNNALTASAQKIMPYLPPIWLVPPVLYVAIALAFIFVLVVFI